MRVVVTDQPLNPWESVAAYQQTLRPGSFGAGALFVGSMRDLNDGREVSGMQLEHYPGMTEQYLKKISRMALERWPLLDTFIAHRVGALRPGDPIVVVAVWSEHRAAAFDACRFLMEELKSRAPFWKKEALADGGERWVEKNTEE